jgi:spermidine synthase
MLIAASPQMKAEAVEIDPAIVQLAARYFDIRALPRFTIHLEDATAFLRRCTSRYGVVVLDTYVGEQFPDRCATQEFIKDIRKCMLDDGVSAVNWLNGNSQMREGLIKNLEEIVGPVWQLPGLRTRNIVYFAGARKIPRPAIVSAAAALEAEIPFGNSLKHLAQRLRNIK